MAIIELLNNITCIFVSSPNTIQSLDLNTSKTQTFLTAPKLHEKVKTTYQIISEVEQACALLAEAKQSI